MKQQEYLSIHQLLGKSVSLWEKFHSKTKISLLEKHPLDRKDWPKEWKETYYKAYGRLKEIKLPMPASISQVSLQKALESRKSTREFSSKAISGKDVSTLLYWTAGIKKNKTLENRFYPSAGARYPLETYILAQNCQLEKGLYHYYVRNNSLEKLLSLKTFNFNQYFNQHWIPRAGVLVILTAVFKRNTIKYGDRGYRHILIEAGHLAQNLYLVATAQNLSVCAVGGYNDKKFEELLDIDGLSESIVYILAVGRH